MTEYEKDLEIINDLGEKANKALYKSVKIADAMKALILSTERDLADRYTIETISNMKKLSYDSKTEKLKALTDRYMYFRVKEEVLRRAWSDYKTKIDEHERDTRYNLKAG